MLMDYLKLILKDIKNRKFSSFLTFFAIGLGILSIFTIILVSQGFTQSIEQQFEKIGSNRLIISATGSGVTMNKKSLTDNVIPLIESKPFVLEASPHYFTTAQIKYQNEYIGRMILGTNFDEDYFKSFNLEISEGRYPKSVDKYGVVIGPKAATDLFDKELKIGSNIYIKDTKFKVIGITESLGNPEDDKNMYFNLKTLRNLYNDGEKINMLYVTIDKNYDMNLAKDNMKTFLDNRLGTEVVKIQTFEQMIEQFKSILNIVKLTLGGIAFVALIVGAIGIINTMYVVITEKTKDIGIMKAIGAKNQDIFLLYTIQAGIFGLFGAAFGIFFGSIGAIGFSNWASQNGFDLTITIQIIPVLTLLLFGFGVGVLSGFLPAYKASKLKIVETFRK